MRNFSDINTSPHEVYILWIDNATWITYCTLNFQNEAVAAILDFDMVAILNFNICHNFAPIHYIIMNNTSNPTFFKSQNPKIMFPLMFNQ